MSDPLDRDRFPDRPDHPDFWKLSEAVLWLDGRANEGHQSAPEIAAEFIDPDALQYVARHRVAMARQTLGFQNEAEFVVSLAMWTDAFVAGCKFQANKEKQK